MIVDASGRHYPPVVPPAPPAILPFARLLAVCFVLGLVAWRAWAAAGFIGLACVVAYIILQVR